MLQHPGLPAGRCPRAIRSHPASAETEATGSFVVPGTSACPGTLHPQRFKRMLGLCCSAAPLHSSACSGGLILASAEHLRGTPVTSVGAADARSSWSMGAGMGEGGNLKSGAQQCYHSNRRASVSIKRPRSIHVSWSLAHTFSLEQQGQFFVKGCRLFSISETPRGS